MSPVDAIIDSRRRAWATAGHRARSCGRVALLVTGLAVASAWQPAALAAPGETLRVTATSLYLRDSPSLEGSIIARLRHGARVSEYGSQGPWLRVEVSDGDTEPPRRGWIHGRYEEPEGQWLERGRQATGPLDTSDVVANARQPMREFRREFTRLDDAYHQATGTRLFSDMREQPGRVLQLTATPSWLAGTEGDREIDVNTILHIWKTANSDYPVMVRVVDKVGKTVLVAYD